MATFKQVADKYNGNVQYSHIVSKQTAYEIDCHTPVLYACIRSTLTSSLTFTRVCSLRDMVRLPGAWNLLNVPELNLQTPCRTAKPLATSPGPGSSPNRDMYSCPCICNDQQSP